MIPIQPIIFYVFSALMIVAATCVITVRNPVYSILFLVLAFFCSAGLWILLQAEFLALVLVFVYVGAVMTLFLFVVMMLNIDLTTLRKRFVKFFPLLLGIAVLLMLALLLAFVPAHYGFEQMGWHELPQGVSNTQILGQLLYTQFIYPFEITGIILLVGIIAAITLAFYGRKKDAKSQNIATQHEVTKATRLRMVKFPKE